MTFKVLCERMNYKYIFYYYLQMPGLFQSHHLNFQVLLLDWLLGKKKKDFN